jgi:hypothetical protein
LLSILWRWPLTSATTQGRVQHVGVSWQEPPVPGVIRWRSIPSLTALGRALPTRWLQCKGVPWQDILCSSILIETGGPVVEYPQANGTSWQSCLPRQTRFSEVAFRGKVTFRGEVAVPGEIIFLGGITLLSEDAVRSKVDLHVPLRQSCLPWQHHLCSKAAVLSNITVFGEIALLSKVALHSKIALLSLLVKLPSLAKSSTFGEVAFHGDVALLGKDAALGTATLCGAVAVLGKIAFLGEGGNGSSQWQISIPGKFALRGEVDSPSSSKTLSSAKSPLWPSCPSQQSYPPRQACPF